MVAALIRRVRGKKAAVASGKTHRLVFRAVDRAIFDDLVSGRKKVETRAAGPKYRGIAAGDTIVLACGEETKELTVKRATHFPSVSSMLQTYSVKDIVPDLSTAAELELLYASFPDYPQKLAKYGIIAIELAH